MFHLKLISLIFNCLLFMSIFVDAELPTPDEIVSILLFFYFNYKKLIYVLIDFNRFYYNIKLPPCYLVLLEQVPIPENI